MTRHTTWPGVVAAAGVGTLAWSAWKIVAADLPLSAGVAAWGLWLVVAAAALTLVGYTRELARHRHALRDLGSWRPLPGLGLLWIAGVAAAVSFAIVLPSSPVKGTERAVEPTSGSRGVVPTADASTPGRTSTPSSRSQSRTASPTASPTATAAPPGPSVIATTRSSSAGGGAATTTSSSTTSSPSSSTAPTPDPTRPGRSKKTKPPHPR